MVVIERTLLYCLHISHIYFMYHWSRANVPSRVRPVEHQKPIHESSNLSKALFPTGTFRQGVPEEWWQWTLERWKIAINLEIFNFPL
jgi:hypothetical protein